MQNVASLRPLEAIVYEKRNSKAYVTLNRPKVMNALSQNAIGELRLAFEDAKKDPENWGVIITGSGDGAIIACADTAKLAEASPNDAERQARVGRALLNLTEQLGEPVITAVNGVTFGDGCETALACTIRLTNTNAKFDQPEIELGLIPGYGGTQRLARSDFTNSKRPAGWP
jgi:enoyl-CoA hydratase